MRFRIHRGSLPFGVMFPLNCDLRIWWLVRMYGRLLFDHFILPPGRGFLFNCRLMRPYLPVAIVAVVFFIAVGAGTSLFFWKERTAQTKAASSKEPSVAKPSAEPAHIRGSPAAPLKIEEFGDFQCPSCAALAPALTQAEQKYRGKVCISFRQFPF